MKNQNSAVQTTRYTKVAIALHWVIALLIIGQIIGGKYMHSLDPTPEKFELYQMHKSFGLIILILSFIRLFWRIGHRPPVLPNAMAGWEKLLSKLTHLGFYILMIGTPVIGWMMVSASPINIPTKIFGTIPWPDFPGLTRSESAVNFFKEFHELMAYAIIGLLFLHIAGALKHYFLGKDDVLSRMLPFLKRSDK